MSKIKVIGLTGQTGAGKSTVSEVFQRHGFAVINADLVAREVVAPGTPCLAEIFAVYGDAVKAPDGSLDRSATARIVFADKEELSRYNAIIFPYINKAVGERIARIEKDGAEDVLLDAPTLFESKADQLCDAVVSVTAPEEMRLTRIMERDHLNEEDARRRMNAQLSEEFFLSHSTYAICNDQGLDALDAAAEDVVYQILAKFEK